MLYSGGFKLTMSLLKGFVLPIRQHVSCANLEKSGRVQAR